ncbi:hypothetical protein HDU81_009943 [Chytriomyces hyalinus]|nr:hypothetical protein HDU81_009943 [Chytriomyces hyalinus]
MDDEIAELLGSLQSPLNDEGEYDSLDGPVFEQGFEELLLGLGPSDSIKPANTTVVCDLQPELETAHTALFAQKNADDALQKTRLSLLFSAQPDPPTVRTTAYSGVASIAIAAEAFEKESLFGCDARSVYASCFEEDFCDDGNENATSNSGLDSPVCKVSSNSDALELPTSYSLGLADAQAQPKSDQKYSLEQQTTLATPAIYSKHALKEEQNHISATGGQNVFTQAYKRMEGLLSTRPKTLLGLFLWLVAAPILLVVVAPIYQVSIICKRVHDILLRRVCHLKTVIHMAYEQANIAVALHIQNIISKVSLAVSLNGNARHFVEGCVVVALVPVLGVVVAPGMCIVACYWICAFWIYTFGQSVVSQ